VSWLQRWEWRKPSSKHDESTDDATLEMAKMVFAGKINTDILAARQTTDRAVGLSGVMANIVHASAGSREDFRPERSPTWAIVVEIPLPVDLAAGFRHERYCHPTPDRPTASCCGFSRLHRMSVLSCRQTSCHFECRMSVTRRPSIDGLRHSHL